MKRNIIISLLPVLLLLFSTGFSSVSGNVNGSPLLFTELPGINEDIVTAFRTGNAAGVSKYLNPTVDLSLPGHESTCSKQQAEQILKTFFTKYPPKSFKINHQGASRDGSQFYIGSYVSDKGTSFRIYFLMKKQGNIQLIQQIQIDEE